MLLNHTPVESHSQSTVSHPDVSPMLVEVTPCC